MGKSEPFLRIYVYVRRCIDDLAGGESESRESDRAGNQLVDTSLLTGSLTVLAVEFLEFTCFL